MISKKFTFSLTFVALFTSFSSGATEQDWLVVSGLSYHSRLKTDSERYREFNYGLGWRRDLENSNWSIEGTWYKNSLNRGSWQVAASWFPFGYDTEGLGLRMGVVTGYQKMPAPYIFPTYVIKTDVGKVKLAVDFLFLPGFIANKTTVGAVAVRIGF